MMVAVTTVVAEAGMRAASSSDQRYLDRITCSTTRNKNTFHLLEGRRTKSLATEEFCETVSTGYISL